MWGENLLVTPVLEKGAKDRNLYLPKGKWLNIFSNIAYDGGRWITIPVDLNTSPVFMKEGAFVPTVSRIKNVSEYLSNGQYLLNYFPSATKTNFTWFEDDGVSKNSLLAKRYSLIKCSGQDAGEKISVDVSTNNQLFVPKSLGVSVIVNKKPSAVFLNGRSLPLVSNVSDLTKPTKEFALWMPQIFAVQVYTEALSRHSLKIDVIK